MNGRNNNPVAFENLENRQMLAANPLDVAIATRAMNSGGYRLEITGTSKSDSIFVTSTAGGLKVNMNGLSRTVAGQFKAIIVRGGRGNDSITLHSSVNAVTTLQGNAGNDTIVGGSGSDKIYGGAGTDLCNGGAGDDLIVSIGDSTTDKSFGGAGFDSLWTDTAESSDASNDEILAGNLHKVGSFFSFSSTRKGKLRSNKVGLDLNGQNLVDPLLDDSSARYQNFSANPLFSTNGPVADDVAQGYVGDCWYLATLSAVAKVNPNVIKQSVVELGDGTYAVQFTNGNGIKSIVRVDGDLAVSAWGGMQYASLGAQNSVWVAIMEKALAYYRTGAASYASISGGWMSEAFGSLGFDSTQIWNANDGSDLLDQISGELDSGKAVTLAIYQARDGAPVVGYHAYQVEAVENDGKGNRTLVLRNPWGIDGAGNDGANDGYVRLTAQQAFSSYWGVISASC